jgi:hypothetical protein
MGAGAKISNHTKIRHMLERAIQPPLKLHGLS